MGMHLVACELAAARFLSQLQCWLYLGFIWLLPYQILADV